MTNDNNSLGVSAGELRAFIERAEQLDAEKRDIMEQSKELFSEAKGRGYCVRTLKRIIALRKITADALAEQEAIEDLYRSALGM